MSLSISSSKQPASGFEDGLDPALLPEYRSARNMVVAVIASVLAIVMLMLVEWHWRERNYTAGLLDSPQLWSIERDAANRAGDKALVFIGASRTVYNIDLDSVRALLPDHEPVMLAVNGRYPLATLRDLANDPAFHGTIICDIDSRGLMKANHQHQQLYVDYYRRHWSPNWDIHRRLLNHWQSLAVIGNPEFGAAATLRRLLDSSPPPGHSYARLHSDRSGALTFAETNAAALASWFADGLRDDLANNRPPSPEQWLEALAPVRQWVEALEARGGRVIFYEAPVSGRQLSLANEAYPAALYWWRFIDMVGTDGLRAVEVADLDQFELPDESHLDANDRQAYTEALVHTLLAHQLISTTMSEPGPQPAL